MKRMLFAVALAGCFDSNADGAGSGRGSLFDGGLFDRPSIRLRPDRIGFGRVLVGTPARRTVRIENTGAGVLRISGLALAFGGDRYRLRIGGQPPASVLDDPDQDGAPGLDPGSSFELEVTLLAASVGKALGSLVVASNDPARSEVEVVLVGTVSRPRCLDLPAEVSFDDLRVGQAQERIIELETCNDNHVTVEAVHVEGAGPFDVSAPLPPFRVPPAQEAVVHFAPRAPGPFESSLLVTSDDDAETDQRVVLRGVGVVNECPVADVGAEQLTGLQGRRVWLDGRRSTDPDGVDGRPLEYHWRTREAPAAVRLLESSQGSPDDPRTPRVTFVPEAAGRHVIELRVTDERTPGDALLQCPASVGVVWLQVERFPRPELEVELSWITPGSPDPRRPGNEVELLLRHPLAAGWDDERYVCTIGSDCADRVWDPPEGNPIPRAFGRQDPPVMAVEVVRARRTEGRPYRVAVHYKRRFDVDEFDYGPAFPRVRVRSNGAFLFDSGVAFPEYALGEQGTVWEVVDFGWPAGRVVVVNRTRPGPP